jgi:hypothetical protein
VQVSVDVRPPLQLAEDRIRVKVGRPTGAGAAPQFAFPAPDRAKQPKVDQHKPLKKVGSDDR